MEKDDKNISQQALLPLLEQTETHVLQINTQTKKH